MGGSELDLNAGKQAYAEHNCLLCHGEDGSGGTGGGAIVPPKKADNDNIDGLSQYISKSMPVVHGEPEDCVSDCARNVAAYILNGFSTEQTGAVSEEKRAERVSKGDTLYRNPRVNCIVCHGNAGTKTVGDGKSLENCGVCGSWTELRDYISAEMPPAPEGGDAETGPHICAEENDCADRLADWIWNKVNNWTLTESGGERVQTENKYGQDTKRLKSYSMLKTDFSRIFGSVPSILESSAAAFKASPDYWYAEPEMGAVSLNILANAAVQSCEKEALPAINESALRASCSEWANKMWLRDASDEEIESCVKVATDDTESLSNKERAVFACVSMMISLPALTY